jgi:sterol desaturase/sphingolipid hydroxylase (fatty acid hydroxylase superfamily)
MVWIGPFITAHSAFVHANLNWTLGPFKYVIAGPVFHRWHHTAADRGGSSNFAGTFPIWDLLFGTFYMPEHEMPDAYGIADKSFPEGFSAQMLYPFRKLIED